MAETQTNGHANGAHNEPGDATAVPANTLPSPSTPIAAEVPAAAVDTASDDIESKPTPVDAQVAHNEIAPAASTPIGLGISESAKDLPPSPSTPVALDPADIATPPPVPSKTDEGETGVRPALQPGEAVESRGSLQDVALSRAPTPAVAARPASARPPSQSTSTLPSASSSPSRPASAHPRPGGTGHHSRRSSAATTLSLASHAGAGAGASQPHASPQLSTVLIMPPLQTLVASKEARKSPSFLVAAQRALDLCQAGGGAAHAHPRDIFEPLRLAISNPQTTSVPILITSLDLLAKLVSHSFFSEPHGPPKGLSPLPDLITHTITLSYSEASPPQVALQVVKALMAVVLSTDRGMLVHQSSLLKAVRTVYNVFLLSNDHANQVVAQGGLTQMVQHVFGRVVRPDPRSAMRASQSAASGLSENEARRQAEEEEARSRATPVAENGNGNAEANEDGPKMTLESFSAPNPNDDIPAAPAHLDSDAAAAGPPLPAHTISIPVPNGDALDTPEPVQASGGPADHEGHLDVNGRPVPTEELFVKDAFLVFRALCKLSMKALVTESERDLRSHAMRSKLLSLHLVLTILKSHVDLFNNPAVVIPSNSSLEMTPFLQATKQYLCFSLSRNAVSPVTQVFELCTEIFWCVIKSLRAQLKKEIEVLLSEIFIPFLEMRHSTIRQKSLVLAVFIRLCQDPQALVEIYINYDCDRGVGNIYERLMNIVSKIGQTHFAPPSKEELVQSGAGSKQASGSAGPALPGSLGTTALVADINAPQYAGLPPEVRLRRQSLECLVAALKSLAAWSSSNPQRQGDEGPRPSIDGVGRHQGSSSNLELATPSLPFDRRELSGMASGGTTTPDIGEDDVGRLESAKQRKTMLQEGIKKFNFKPKRGIDYLVEHGFIKSKAPQDIARFLLHNDGLSKAMIGEYLGEGDEANVATMHAFVDMLEFTGLNFTDALRMYLQTFRLPGEAQKIDRFMLKFAERYIQQNPSTHFANAGTAYVLAFSVIMLNTDAHNKNLKTKRMTKPEFVKNNRGIDDGKDLPEEFLGELYDEIQSNEIKMKDEVEAAPATGALAAVGRDLQREAYFAQSETMANKTEAMLKAMVRQQRRGVTRGAEQFYSASRLEHVRFMFEVAWMPFLAGISGPLQETDAMDVVELCLDGLRAAIRIVCLFDMELERNAFVTTLAKFTFLNNLGEMRPKNMEAIKSLLDIALTDGNHLKASWKDVLTCVSQLERMQLISSGMDVPDMGSGRRNTVSKGKGPAGELAEEAMSSQVTVAADKVFALSQNLSGSAIVDFVQALSEVSWEEIQSSGSSTRPRLFSLQKLVEISYYNMGRIRLEWSNIWLILGEHFNQVCCHNNPNVSFFALDALRQLAMNFLEKEELSHFRFQKDFLRPFEYTIVHNPNSDAREMVLQCLHQMIQARVQNLRSGWRTMFGVFSAASKVLTERVAGHAFELVTLVHREHFALVVRYGAFADLTNCVSDFCKVSKFQKISLQAIEMIRGLVPKIINNPDCFQTPAGESKGPDDVMLRYWLPVLMGFYEIIMTGEDMEVRRVALDCLFDTLKTHGAGFSTEFWEAVCTHVLFPMFGILTAKTDVRFKSAEDLSVWLSTTLISALRDTIDLYTFYFAQLQRYLDGLLDILVACICQENDTLARIGTSCFQQLLESNVTKLSPENWEIIVTAFVQLFRTTTAYHLFDDVLAREVAPDPTDAAADDDAPFNKFVAPAPLAKVVDRPAPLPERITHAEQRRIFKQIIVKCVLQLLLIETTHELLQNDDVYNTIPAEHLLRFMGVLDDSWRFARKFNADKDLRMRLWKVGFMKQLPNLLKQESSSAATLINVLLRMYRDPREAHKATRGGVLDRLVPLGTEIIRDFIAIDAETQPRNVAAWSPVVADILRGACAFDDAAFEEHVASLYPLVADLLARELGPEMRIAARDFFLRVGVAKGIITQ
ncbi:guanine nucleotide exchange protein for ADP-robosylation factor [Cryptotrichosporon argae]